MRLQGIFRPTILAVLLLTTLIMGGETASAALPEAVEADPFTSVSHPLEPVEITSLGIQGIFGPDERTRVAATTVSPYSMVVLLVTTWRDGSVGTCSGFMIGPRVVGTAGHCVYNQGRGGWASRIVAVPGADGARAPFGAFPATELRTVEGWLRARAAQFDIAAVTLASDVGARTGLFHMRTTSDDALRRGAYVAAGYPGDKSDATMWISSGSINDVTPDLLLFRFNVTFGNSGGPIWEQTANGYEAVGLVEGSTADTNVGVRASEQVTRTFRRWSGTSPEAPGSVNGAPPAVAAAPQTMQVQPATLSAPNGTLTYAQVTLGATAGRGDLILSTSDGVLVADGLLTPLSCHGGTGACAGVSGNASARLLIPDTGSNLGTVVVTLMGTVQHDATITVVARQGGDSWQVAIPVRVQGTAPGIAVGGRITSGVIPPDGGLALIVFSGGSGAQLLAAAGCSAATAAFWSIDGGAFVTYVPGTAIAAVNAAWEAKFPNGIPADTVLLARCR